jgi:hypothetical protein
MGVCHPEVINRGPSNEESSVTTTAARPTATRRGHMPLWLMLVGVVIAATGAIIMGVASGKKDSAQNLTDYSKAYGSTFGQSQVDAAVMLGHFGLGILIFGAALVLVGLAAQAMRR